MVKTALVLGGGGTRGIAHIGAIRAFEKMEVKFDAVAGCSIGAIIGAMYCAGKKSQQLENFVKKHKVNKILDLSISKQGIYKTKKLAKELEKFLGVRTFKSLKKPLYINAVNISTGKEESFSSGNLIDAIMASIAIPGIFHPYKKGKSFYVDGGVLNQNPVSILPRKIKRYVIINVSQARKGIEDLSIFNVIQKSMDLLQQETSRLKIKNIKKNRYVMIKPDVGNMPILQFRNDFKDILDEGEEAAKIKKKEILYLRKNAFHRFISNT
jgi:NTE family protein